MIRIFQPCHRILAENSMDMAGDDERKRTCKSKRKNGSMQQDLQGTIETIRTIGPHNNPYSIFHGPPSITGPRIPSQLSLSFFSRSSHSQIASRMITSVAKIRPQCPQVFFSGRGVVMTSLLDDVMPRCNAKQQPNTYHYITTPA